VIGNPLNEYSNYANPAYKDPKSPWYERYPEQLLWRRWQVRVGYLPFDLIQVFGWDCGSAANLMVPWQGGDRELIELQRQIFVAGQLQPSGFVPAGYAGTSSRVFPEDRVAQNEDVKVVFWAESWGDAAWPGWLGWVTVENVSSHPVTIYDDPELPSVVQIPPQGAEVFYGLRKFNGQENVIGPELFGVTVLSPGQSHRYVFVLGNPLRELGRYSPAWEDPQSPYYHQWRHKFWKTCKVHFAYFPFDVVQRLSLKTARGDSQVDFDGRKQDLIDLQRQLILE
jgi:hypothetical protein